MPGEGTGCISYEDLRLLPAPVIVENISGELVTSPRPDFNCAFAATGLIIAVGSPFHFGVGGPGGWVILAEPKLHLGADLLVPDLAGWRLARVPAPSLQACLDVPPDWVCEILSPATARLDRLQKMPIYLQHAVPHLWLVDPLAKTLEVYTMRANCWLLRGFHRFDEVVRVVPFEAVAVELERWWGSGR